MACPQLYSGLPRPKSSYWSTVEAMRNLLSAGGQLSKRSCAQGGRKRVYLSTDTRSGAEVALALQRDCLEVDPADQDEVAVERHDLVRGQLKRIVGMLGALTLGGQQLDQLRLVGRRVVSSGSGGSSPGSFDGHVPLLACSGPPAGFRRAVVGHHVPL